MNRKNYFAAASFVVFMEASPLITKTILDGYLLEALKYYIICFIANVLIVVIGKSFKEKEVNLFKEITLYGFYIFILCYIIPLVIHLFGVIEFETLKTYGLILGIVNAVVISKILFVTDTFSIKDIPGFIFISVFIWLYFNYITYNMDTFIIMFNLK